MTKNPALTVSREGPHTPRGVMYTTYLNTSISGCSHSSKLMIYISHKANLPLLKLVTYRSHREKQAKKKDY